MDDKFSSSRSTYGASQRGEAIFSEIVISNEPVQYPFVEDPDYILALSRLGLEAYIDGHWIDDVKNDKKTFLFFDSTMQIDEIGMGINIELVKINIGKRIENRNTILLGCFTKFTKVLSKSSLENAITKNVSKKYLNQNLKAFDFGYNSV